MAKYDLEHYVQSGNPPETGKEPIATREESLEDFTPEWCQTLLKDPSYEHTFIFTRKLGGPMGPTFNNLMSKTLFTDSTIRAIKTLYKPKGSNSLGGEVLALISLGDELCSHVNVLHGGINTVLVDEVGGHLANLDHPSEMMAVNFNVNLRKSVRIPGIALGRAWVERPPEGRKVWVKVNIEQDGVKCIEAENLYVKLRSQGKL